MEKTHFKRKKLSTVFTIVALYTFLSASNSLAQNQCENIFYSSREAAIDSFKSSPLSDQASLKFLDAAKSELNSTTGNRVERKFTTSFSKIDAILKILRSSLQKENPAFTLDARDKKTPGYYNITHTKYLTKLSLAHNGENLTTKIRLRKYGLISEKETVSNSNFQPIKEMFDKNEQPISWLEFKIEHPQYEKAVLKPRIKIHDKFAKLLEHPKEFLKELKTIREETKLLNTEKKNGSLSNKDQLVDDMIDALKHTLSEGVQLKEISETLYERTSYAINLKNKSSDQSVNIQLTLDRDIHQFSTVLDQQIPSYDPSLDLAVLEIKIPVQYSQFTNEDINSVPDLIHITALINNMAEAQQDGYAMDAGKFARAVQALMEFGE